MTKKFEISAFTLHILAMFFMLLDHTWATVIEGNMWMTYVGRLAFPMFAFFTVEGFFHTKNFKKYMKRMFIFALLSEIPFNLVCSGKIFFLFHQNVIFTLLIALFFMNLMEKVRNSDKKASAKFFSCFGLVLAGFVLGTVLLVDYDGFGVLTVFLFYFFHGKGFKNKLGQALGLYVLNFFLISGMDIPFMLFGKEFFFPSQGFALLSLPFIWLYQGKQGPHNKWIQYAFYAFYPLHLLILALIALL